MAKERKAHWDTGQHPDSRRDFAGSYGERTARGWRGVRAMLIKIRRDLGVDLAQGISGMSDAQPQGEQHGETEKAHPEGRSRTRGGRR